MSHIQGEDAPVKFLADQYRRYAFELLHAAQKLTETATALQGTRGRVSRPAVADLAAARELIDALPAVRAATTLEKV